MNNATEKLTSVERKTKINSTTFSSFRPPTADGTKSKPARPQLKPISTPANTTNNVKSLISLSGASASSRKCRPLVESHRQAMRVERDILGLPIVKKDSKHDAGTPLNSARSSASTGPKGPNGRVFGPGGERMSLFEALELADSLENQEYAFDRLVEVDISRKDDFEKTDCSEVTTESIDFECSDIFKRETTSTSSVAKFANNAQNLKTIVGDVSDDPKISANLCQNRMNSQRYLKDNPEATAVYNRYLRSLFLAKNLEHAHSKRKISAFSQLAALAEENNRLEDEICQLKIDSERQAYNQILWELFSVQSEQTAKLVKTLQDFLPMFTKFALLVDSTRHRFFFDNIDVPSYQKEPEANLEFCVKLTELLETQKSLLESILSSNGQKRFSESELQNLIRLGEMFLKSSKVVEKDFKVCEEKCRELFLLVDRRDSSDLPSILNSVSSVDNCDLDIFKF